MYQQIILVGNLGRDPETRFTPNGTQVTNFSIATNVRWNDRESGEPRERTTWWRVAAWRGLAENCAKYLSKGRQVLVVCQTNPDPETGGPRVFARNDGSYGANYEVTASDVRFLGSRGESVSLDEGEQGEEAPDELLDLF